MVKIAESEAGVTLPSLLVDVGNFALNGRCDPLQSKRAWAKLEKFILSGETGSEPIAGFFDLKKIQANFRSAIALKGQNQTQLLVDLIHEVPYHRLPVVLESFTAEEMLCKQNEVQSIIDSPVKFSKIELKGLSVEGVYEKLIESDYRIARIESEDFALLRSDTKIAVRLFKLHRELWKERADLLLKLDLVWEALDPEGYARAVQLQVEHAYLHYNNSRGYLRPSYQNRLAEFVTPDTSCPQYLKPKQDGGSNLHNYSQALIHDRNADWKTDWRYSPSGYRHNQRIYKALFPECHLSNKGIDEETFFRRQKLVAERSKSARLKLLGE